MVLVLLAAEEEPGSSRVVARLALEAAGHTVQEIYDGQSVLAQVEAAPPDVLVLDTSLPVLDGFQVLARLRRHHALRQLPVVMLSTIPKGLGGELARSMGAVRFLAKPFTAAELTEAVEGALTRRDHPAWQEPAAAPAASASVRSPAEWRARGALPDAASLIELAPPGRHRAGGSRRRPRGA